MCLLLCFGLHDVFNDISKKETIVEVVAAEVGAQFGPAMAVDARRGGFGSLGLYVGGSYHPWGPQKLNAKNHYLKLMLVKLSNAVIKTRWRLRFAFFFFST